MLNLASRTLSVGGLATLLLVGIGCTELAPASDTAANTNPAPVLTENWACLSSPRKVVPRPAMGSVTYVVPIVDFDSQAGGGAIPVDNLTITVCPSVTCITNAYRWTNGVGGAVN